MDKIIELKTRGCHNYLKQLSKVNSDKESKTYRLITESNYIRVGTFSDNVKYIDPTDGPLIYEGCNIEGYRVKTIDYIKGIGHIITFE